MDQPRPPNEDDVLAMFTSCSNAGRWGDDDEQGTLNHITAARRLSAIRTVTEGVVYSLGRDLRLGDSNEHPSSAVHRMADPGTGADAAIDYVGIRPHGFEVTHVDALGHNWFDGRVYNDRPVSEVLAEDGLRFGSILAMREGVVARGVLLDVAEARGVAHLEPGDGISIADLVAAERAAATTVRAGDAVFVRSGLDRRLTGSDRGDSSVREGVLAEVVGWLHEREVSMYGGDCIERIPSGYDRVPMPLHQIGLTAMGLALLDNPDMERLRRACDAHRRRQFLVIVAPLRIPRGTGSAVNPLVVF